MDARKKERMRTVDFFMVASGVKKVSEKQGKKVCRLKIYGQGREVKAVRCSPLPLYYIERTG